MKILAVSLLRLGDLIQQIPLLKGLRADYPEAEIHILINKQFFQSRVLLGNLVDKFHFFDREELQKGLGEASYNIFWSYTEVEKQIAELKAQSYDQIYNLTHTRLSAYLVGLIKAPVRGLRYDQGRFQGLESRWMRYFNERFSGTGQSIFHYVEALGSALDIARVQPAAVFPWAKKEKLILMQCLTSDIKKNWSLAKFQQLKKNLNESLGDYRIKILSADFERESLLQVFSAEDLIVCDLSEAQEHLKRACLLITGDTSIKHLAAQVGTPLVELVLGSSDFYKTRAFTPFAWAVRTPAACAPCAHSSKCPKSSHVCAEELTVEAAFTAVWNALSQAPFPVVYSESQELERAVWSAYLGQNSPATLNISGETKTLALQKQVVLDGMLERIQKGFQESSGKMASEKKLEIQEIENLIVCAQDILKGGWDREGYFIKFIEALTVPFQNRNEFFQRLQNSLTETSELLSLRKDTIHRVTEKSQEGLYNAKGIEQLSNDRTSKVGASSTRNTQDADL